MRVHAVVLALSHELHAYETDRLIGIEKIKEQKRSEDAQYIIKFTTLAKACEL